MHYKRISNSTPPKVTIDGLMLVALLTVGSLPFFSRARVKNETIEASAIGTSTQLGQVVGVSIEIYDFSTPMITNSSSRPLKKARTVAWSTHSPR